MGEQRLSQLLERSGVAPRAGVEHDPLVRGAAIDSRRVEPGNLFFAVRGLRADGVAFVPEALSRGAVAVVAGSPRPAALPAGVAWVEVDQPRHAAAALARECYGRPDLDLTIAGITGTNGKTTVVHLLESIAAAAGRRAARMGTIGAARQGAEQALDRTTPEAPELYALLDEMRDAGTEFVAMEVSSHALSLHRVDGLKFDVAAFLNLGRDHLDFHGDEEAYFEAKAQLFDALSPEAWAVLPADAAQGERLRRRTSARVLTFGRSAGEVRLRDEHCGVDGSAAVLETPKGRLPVRTFLPGAFNLDNVAAAAACALACGMPGEAITSGVLNVDRVAGRLERVDRGQPFRVLVDYAHTPHALRALLEWARGSAEGRVFVVFGCGGERDQGKRPQMGQVAAELADRVFLTSDNPRGEPAEEILEQIARGAAGVEGAGRRVRRIVDRRQAIERALDEAEPGDIVIVAGKGHEDTQTIGRRVLRFDDREVVAEALAAIGWRGRCRAGA